MARTESLMGRGKLFAADKPGLSGVDVQYQLQSTEPDAGGQNDWTGFVRLPTGNNLPGSNSPNPTRNARYTLLLEDNDARRGTIEIERAYGEVKGFHNFAIRGLE
jgi:hypothetical protein